MSSKGYVETEDQNRLRFQVELEFVQCLANPNYIHFLAQRGYFKDPKFVNYLKYLLYWKQPEFAKFLKYPMCLYFLDLLQYETFRRETVNAQCCKFIDDQSILLWQHYTRRRNRMFTINNGTIQMNPDNNAQQISNVGQVSNNSNMNNNSNSNSNTQINSNNTQSNNTPIAQTNGIGSNSVSMSQKVT